MAARLRASFGRQAMTATLGVRLATVERGRIQLGVVTPCAVMEATTLTAVYDPTH